MYPDTDQYKIFARAYLRRQRHSTISSQNNCADKFTSHLHKLCSTAPKNSTIAAFLPLPSEPPITAGLKIAHGQGHRILVPVVKPGRQLSWVRWEPDAPVLYNSLGIAEPTGPKLGAEAFIEAHLRLIPALAYDINGNRLGQGGGYYDRLLALLPPSAQGCSTLGVVFAREILDGLPHDRWDARLNYALTEEGIVQLGAGFQNRVQ